MRVRWGGGVMQILASSPPGDQHRQLPEEKAKWLFQQGPSATASSQKQALLVANVEKRIRQLEQCLGLSKHRKGGISSALQSFTQDGMGYVLGALGPETTLSRLYEESSKEDLDPKRKRMQMKGN
ncbi:unnamed protein product [Caretta caretta]